MADTIRVVLAKPGEDAQIVQIENTYEAVRDAVGGCISLMRLTPNEDGVIAYVHDEALLIGLPWNRWFQGQPIAGNILVLGSTADGNDRGLKANEVAAAMYYLNLKCERLATTPSSIEELEALTGRPAVMITTIGEDGLPVTIDARTGKKVDL